MLDLNPPIKAVNTATVVLRDTSVCNLEVHTIGHPAKEITNPILDLAVYESMFTVSGDQLPLKSRSHH